MIFENRKKPYQTRGYKERTTLLCYVFHAYIRMKLFI